MFKYQVLSLSSYLLIGKSSVRCCNDFIASQSIPQLQYCHESRSRPCPLVGRLINAEHNKVVNYFFALDGKHHTGITIVKTLMLLIMLSVFFNQFILTAIALPETVSLIQPGLMATAIGAFITLGQFFSHGDRSWWLTLTCPSFTPAAVILNPQSRFLKMHSSSTSSFQPSVQRV